MLSVQKKDTGIGFEVSGHELTCIIMGGGGCHWVSFNSNFDDGIDSAFIVSINHC